MKQPTWPDSYWSRALILFVALSVVSIVVGGGLALADGATWQQTLGYVALLVGFGGPVFAGVGAAVTRGGRPMLFDLRPTSDVKK